MSVAERVWWADLFAILQKCCLSEIYIHSEVKMSHKGRSQSASFNFQNVHVSHPFVIDVVLRV